MVAAALKKAGDDYIIGAVNFADNNQGCAIQFDSPALNIEDDAWYRLEDPVYSPITSHYNYFTGRELKVSRIRTTVSFVERIKLLRLRYIEKTDDNYELFFRDSFVRLSELSRPVEFEENFAFRELAGHCRNFRELSAYVRNHLVDRFWEDHRDLLHLGLKRAFYHLYRTGALTATDALSFMDKLAAHKQETLQSIGQAIRHHHNPGPMIFLSAEADPFSKSGGLANVVYELPRQLAALGEEVWVITPRYRYGTDKAVAMMNDACQKFKTSYTGKTVRFMVRERTFEVGIHTGEADGIKVILLDSPELFDGLYWGVTGEEKLQRRIGFARAATDAICALGLQPLMTFTNDAYAGVFNGIVKSDPLYLNNWNFQRNSFMHIIHNGGWQYFDAFQRDEEGQDLFNLFNLPGWRANDFLDPWHGDRLNCMATGIRYADQVYTVSPSYARQIQYACDGLEKILQDVIGISNGIGFDFYDRVKKRFKNSGFVNRMFGPLQDHISSDRRLRKTIEARFPEMLEGYDAVRAIKNRKRKNLVTRMANKLMLQLERGLEVNPDKIMFVMIHRITEQKGWQLVLEASEGIFKHLGYQAIFGGAVASGDKQGDDMAAGLWRLGEMYHRQVNVSFGFQDIAIPFLAGDFVGMPSMSEPGGLVQLEAFACENLVIARATGGLRDTVQPIRIRDNGVSGNGFLFSDYSAWALYDAMERAARFFREADDETIFEARQNARKSVFHWDQPARRYISESYAIKEIIRDIPN